jgi:3'(2'), 5'-bisphosphate nucleotidase
MKVYDAAFTVQHKLDNSPLTLADLDSQRIIIEGLKRLTPHIPVLSEESAQAPWSERRGWDELWVVDPLDGTREFVKRNGEFTINIALVAEHEPLMGVVSAPAQRLLYWGAAGTGAFSRHEGASQRRIQVAPPAVPIRVVRSRSHATPQTAAYLARLGPHVTMGVGSSLKFCLIAEGEAEIYPRFGPTSEWDTAAGQALLEAASRAWMGIVCATTAARACSMRTSSPSATRACCRARRAPRARTVARSPRARSGCRIRPRPSPW